MVDVDTARLMLSKAFEPLPAFNANDRVITVTGLSRASGLPKSTVHRMVEPGAIGTTGRDTRSGSSCSGWA